MAMQQLQHTLPNGLRVLAEYNQNALSAALGFFVNTGARDELAEQAGISHFLEHMLFKSSKTKDTLELTYQLGALGAQANAFTSEDRTVLYAAVLPESLCALVELFADMLRPRFDPEEFEIERKVILEEIALYLDRPHFFLYERALKDYYQGYSAGNSVIGSEATVRAITPESMSAYHDARYRPGNMVVSVVGKFDWDSVLTTLAAKSAGWQGSSTERVLEAYPAHECSKEYRKSDLEQAQLLFFSEAAHAAELERFAFSVLATIIGDGTGSKLYWELVDPGIVESAGADSDEKDGTGLMNIQASMEPAQIDKVSGIIRQIIADPSDFSEAELERAKCKLASKLVLSGELALGRMLALGQGWLARREVTSLADTLAQVQAVDRTAILKALSKYPLTKWAEFRLLPKAAD